MKMKCILILLIASFAFADLEIEDVQGPIEDIIEKIRKAIPEPIKLEKYNLVIPHNIFVAGSLNVSNFVASGLKAFTFSYNLLSFKIGLDKFTLNTKYSMELPLLKIPLLSIFGDGSLRIAVSNTDINIVVDVLGIYKGEAIKSFDLTIKDIGFSVTGVLGDADLSKDISDVINKNTIEIFHKYNKNISELLRNVLNKVIDAIINKNKTLSVEEGTAIAYDTGDAIGLWEALRHMFESLLVKID